MNFLLTINKKQLIILISFLIFLLLFVFIFSFLNIDNSITKINNITAIKSDIVKPKFSISGKKSEIFITAKNGNFLSKEKILLEDNVKFKSKDFQLISDNVIFDRKNFIATTEDISEFSSKNTSIVSAGFDITENGNIINFKGRTILKIK